MHPNKGIKDRPILSGVQCVHGQNGEGTLPGSSNAGLPGGSPGGNRRPFVQVRRWKPLTRERFMDNIRLALVAAGIDPAPYLGHNFRIGAATTAAKKGVGD